jgi:hypothetical protein
MTIVVAVLCERIPGSSFNEPWGVNFRYPIGQHPHSDDFFSFYKVAKETMEYRVIV